MFRVRMSFIKHANRNLDEEKELVTWTFLFPVFFSLLKMESDNDSYVHFGILFWLPYFVLCPCLEKGARAYNVTQVRLSVHPSINTIHPSVHSLAVMLILMDESSCRCLGPKHLKMSSYFWDLHSSSKFKVTITINENNQHHSTVLISCRCSELRYLI